LIELHPFTQERLNDLEIELRNFIRTVSEDRIASIEKTLANL